MSPEPRASVVQGRCSLVYPGTMAPAANAVALHRAGGEAGRPVEALGCTALLRFVIVACLSRPWTSSSMVHRFGVRGGECCNHRRLLPAITDSPGRQFGASQSAGQGPALRRM